MLHDARKVEGVVVHSDKGDVADEIAQVPAVSGADGEGAAGRERHGARLVSDFCPVHVERRDRACVGRIGRDDVSPYA